METDAKTELLKLLQVDDEVREAAPKWQQVCIDALNVAMVEASAQAQFLNSAAIPERERASQVIHTAWELAEICKEQRIARHKLSEVITEGSPRASRAARRGKRRQRGSSGAPNSHARLKPPEPE